MKTFMMLIGLFLALPTSTEAADVRQVGIICNSEEAAGYFMLEKNLGAHSDNSTVVKEISIPRHWCILGFVRSSRSNASVEHFEDAAAFFGIMHLVGGTFTATLSHSPLKMWAAMFQSEQLFNVGLRRFKRENGKPGYYLVLRN